MEKTQFSLDVIGDEIYMKNLIIFIFFILCVPGMFLAVALYLGLFQGVRVVETSKEPLTAVTLPFQGKYQKVGKKILEVKDALFERGVGCIPMAIYHDDEEKVVKKLLKSEGGCIVGPHAKDLPKEFNTFHFPSQMAVEATVEAHPAIARIKAFSALKAYAEENSVPVNRPIIALFQGDRASFYYYKAKQ